MMSGPTRLPNIAKLGLATRDVMEMPEDQEETPCHGKLLENFEQAVLKESPLPTRNKKTEYSFPAIQKRTSDSLHTAAVYLDQMERVALANLLEHSRTPSQSSTYANTLFSEPNHPCY